jgi:hypothetical protein
MLTFAYHGMLHVGWAACALESRTHEQGPRLPLEEMARMLQCTQMAHVFLGSCEAFEKFFLHKAIHQADGYMQGIPTGAAPTPQTERPRSPTRRGFPLGPVGSGGLSRPCRGTRGEYAA